MVVPFPAGGLDYSTSGIRSAAVIQSESQRWSMVIREANVKPE